MKTVYLRPGELFLSSEPALVRTVLGSCVCLAVFHLPSITAAVSHVTLPRHSGPADQQCSAHLDCLFPKLLRFFDSSGIPRSDLIVKAFGGADVLPQVSLATSGSVGQRNVAELLRLCSLEHLKITAQDVRGTYGRKLVVETWTGAVFVRKLSK